MEDLEGLSLVDLRLVAKKWGIKGVTGYRKQELLEFLRKEQKKQEEPVSAAEEEPAAVEEEPAAVEKEPAGHQISEKNSVVSE